MVPMLEVGTILEPAAAVVESNVDTEPVVVVVVAAGPAEDGIVTAVYDGILVELEIAQAMFPPDVIEAVFSLYRNQSENF